MSRYKKYQTKGPRAIQAQSQDIRLQQGATSVDWEPSDFQSKRSTGVWSAMKYVGINISCVEDVYIVPIKMHSILYIYSSIQREPEK